MMIYIMVAMCVIFAILTIRSLIFVWGLALPLMETRLEKRVAFVGFSVAAFALFVQLSLMGYLILKVLQWA